MNESETSFDVVEDFHCLLDSLFYEGYAAHLATDYPEHYQLELAEFLNTYTR